MIDAFALLDQPRRPWLEPEQLKQAFHVKALQAHPDVQAQAGDGDAFAQLNEAHQILLDPKRRLHHLLSLVGAAPDRTPTSTPKEIEDLFPAVAAATQRASAAIQQSAAATTPLSRALLKPQLLDAASQLDAVQAKLASMSEQAEAQLRELDRLWEQSPGEHLAALHNVYVELSYLTRWTAELEEKQMQLSTC